MKVQYSFSNQLATLYVLATPIGNIAEFSTRAVNILNECSVYIVESKLRALKIINNFQLKNKQIYVLNDKTEHRDYTKILKLIKDNNAVLMSDAGYPCISDPGYLLINEIKKSTDINLVTVNGPNAAIHLLAISGFNNQPFLFYGFLPRKKNKGIKVLESFKDLHCPIIFYESNNRVEQLVENIVNVFGDCDVCLGKELTKKHETIIWTNASNLLLELKNISLVGEYTVIINNIPLK